LLSTCYSQFAQPFIFAKAKLAKKLEIVIDLAKKKVSNPAIYTQNRSRLFRKLLQILKNK